MIITDLLHKRILVAVKTTSSWNDTKAVKEIKILEISPNENWVKVMNDTGQKYWLHSSDIVPMEVLSSIIKPVN